MSICKKKTRSLAWVCALAAGVGCSADMPEVDPLSNRPKKLTVSIGRHQHHLYLKDHFLPQAPAAVSIRGQVIVPPTSIDFAQLRMPTFPKILVVVVNNRVREASTLLPAYVNWRRANGWQVIVGTETAWDKPTTRDGNDRQARIREWLKTQYQDHGAGYLLLIGNPHPEHLGVPMRRTEPMTHLIPYYPPPNDDLEAVPTDHYYADLESDWDCDGDGLFGEHPDDKGEGCADFGPELIVGRLPVYLDGELDHMLARILEYEQASDKAYRDNALFAGAFSGFRGQTSPGGLVYEEDDDSASFLAYTADELPANVKTTRLFEGEGVVESSYAYDHPVNNQNLLQQWSRGASTVAWGGHGWNYSSHRAVWLEDSNDNRVADNNEVDAPAFIQSADAAILEQAPLAVVHMMSCLNGFPEDSGNLGAALIGSGAIATVSASRSAIGVVGDDWEPRPELGSATSHSYYFVQLVQRGYTFGEALAFTRWALPGQGWNDYKEVAPEIVDFSAYSWLTRLEYNLYGDPTQHLDRCAGDSDCDVGLPCNGVETCEGGYCVHNNPVLCTGAELDQCRSWACDNSTGRCSEQPVNEGLGCDDGLWCTVDDSCHRGQCLGSSRLCPDHEGYSAVCDEQAQECTLQSKPSAAQSSSGCAMLPTPINSLWPMLFIGILIRRMHK